MTIIQKIVTHQVQFFIPVPARSIPYCRVDGTDMWRPERLILPDHRTGFCRYAHSIVRTIINQALGEWHISGFAANGDLWWFILDVPKCRFTVESVGDFCQELSDMVHNEHDFVETGTKGGEPSSFRLPGNLLIKLRTKE